ncbi:MAG: nickel-type superoxide dismutase maturation protease [Hormoscilla sp. SP5CHS1]|nr:nickel-type superoxide dismutase maturation protease [Hormoscilla sp. SP12CHS1]MBC6453952.1 nickel-type superoxide dismutase maturation protease [Hormoscilla sp. SP5CHS1]MBC6471878.1 nickel-type superoxide dismutase maturation protease [Hormoscilla sp. GM102CHS1]
MLPLLLPSDEVLVNPRAYRSRLPRPGEIVVACHPARPALRLIKRVAAVSGDRYCQLIGDNPAQSTDSRSFGAVSIDHILGRVTSVFK